MNFEPQPMRVQAALCLYYLMIPSMLLTYQLSVHHTASFSAATTCAQCLNITTNVSNII